jgi:hypothetical protein
VKRTVETSLSCASDFVFGAKLRPASVPPIAYHPTQATPER